MKRTLIISVLCAAALAAFAGWLLMGIHSQKPEYLLKRLAAGKGDREEIIMRLNLARGDVVGAMIRALEDTGAPGEFRATVLELLFKLNHRSAQQKIRDAIIQALHDKDVLVRRMAAKGMAIYAQDDLQIHVTEIVADDDAEVRRQACLVLTGQSRYSPAKSGVWKLLCEEQHQARRQRLIEHCLSRVNQEQDGQEKQLIRSIIAREIETLADEAVQALQASDLEKTESTLRQAMAMDKENVLAATRLARFLVKYGQQEQAIQFAKGCGALLEVPALGEAPEIDGDPADKAWDKAYKTEVFYRTSSRWVALPAEGRSQAFIGHRDGSIYIAVIGYEEDLTMLVRKHTGRDGDVFEDDCVELVFDPGASEQTKYKFVINPVGGMMDKVGQDKSKDFPCKYAAQMFPDRGYWACEFSVSGRDLGNQPIKPGDMWAINVFRVRVGAGSEHCTIWPTYGWADRAENYPLAMFVGLPAGQARQTATAPAGEVGK